MSEQGNTVTFKTVGELIHALACIRALAGYNPEAVKEVVEAARRVHQWAVDTPQVADMMRMADAGPGADYPLLELRDALAKLDGQG